MRNLKIYLWSLLLSGFSLMAQKEFERECILISPESELIIGGSTNVNKFDCKFNMSLLSNLRNIKYSEEGTVINFPDLTLHLLTEGFDCGNKRMNSDFQDLLMFNKYPEIAITINYVELISKEYLKVFITVKLAGKENHYDLPVQIDEEQFIGKFKMNIRDFGLEPPKKALGLIEVDEEIEVQFNMKVSQ